MLVQASCSANEQIKVLRRVLLVMEGLLLCPPGCLQYPASDVDVNAIVIHHEVLGAVLAHLVHLWAGRYPLVEDAVWLLEELLQHLQAAWTLLRIFSSYCQGQFEQARQRSCMLGNPCALKAGSNSLPSMTRNAHPDCMD